MVFFTEEQGFLVLKTKPQENGQAAKTTQGNTTLKIVSQTDFVLLRKQTMVLLLKGKPKHLC